MFLLEGSARHAKIQQSVHLVIVEIVVDAMKQGRRVRHFKSIVNVFREPVGLGYAKKNGQKGECALPHKTVYLKTVMTWFVLEYPRLVGVVTRTNNINRKVVIRRIPTPSQFPSR